jgi:hypothetical protein
MFDKKEEKELMLEQLNQYKGLDKLKDKQILRENKSYYIKAMG